MVFSSYLTHEAAELSSANSPGSSEVKVMSDSIIALPSVVWLVTIRLVGGSVGVEAIIQIFKCA